MSHTLFNAQAKEIRQRRKRLEQKLARDVHRAARELKDNPKCRVPDEEIDVRAEKLLHDLLHGSE